MQDPGVLSSRGGSVLRGVKKIKSNATAEARKGVLNHMYLSN